MAAPSLRRGRHMAATRPAGCAPAYSLPSPNSQASLLSSVRVAGGSSEYDELTVPIVRACGRCPWPAFAKGGAGRASAAVASQRARPPAYATPSSIFLKPHPHEPYPLPRQSTNPSPPCVDCSSVCRCVLRCSRAWWPRRRRRQSSHSTPADRRSSRLDMDMLSLAPRHIGRTE